MSTPHFGRDIRGSDTVPSTQDVARALVEQQGAAAAGVAFITSRQTAGRGRQGKAWHAPPGANLSMTLVGSPIPVSELWQVSFVAAVAAADVVAAIAPGVPVHLRFPNDVLLRGKKVCGILVETATGPDVAGDTEMPLIGVGINIRGRTDALPPEVAVRATTVEAETGADIAVDPVGERLADELTERWTQWRMEGGFAATLAAWHAYHDADARRTFIVDGAPVSCRVIAVSLDGIATLELPDSSQRTIPVPHVLLGDR